MRPAAKHSGRVREFHSKVIAVLPPAGVNDGDGGNGRSARAMPTIARTRHGRSVRGRKTIATTGARTGGPTHNTARATVRLRGSGNATGGARRSLQSLQRWTRQRREPLFRQALIGSFRRLPRGLQRWNSWTVEITVWARAANDAKIWLREKRLSELQRVALRYDLDRIETVLDGITKPTSPDSLARSSPI